MKVYTNLFQDCITLPNLFNAWGLFASGKRKKKDVQAFEELLEDNLAALHDDLTAGTYAHGSYYAFYLHDPKRRHIHKALVRDRVLHRALYEVLTVIYEPVFIYHSYSARLGKGTHKAVDAAEQMIRRCSGNYSKPCYIFKCDIARFFDSVDHEVLLALLGQRIKDEKLIGLLATVIQSADGLKEYIPGGKGIPLGNLTSQIFSNVYLHELDHFVKQTLRFPLYIRYADDFILVGPSKNALREAIKSIAHFLEAELRLKLHHKKAFMVSATQGLDMLGYILFPRHRLLRGTTKKRMCNNLAQCRADDENGALHLVGALASYTGLMQHANCFELSRAIENEFVIS